MSKIAKQPPKLWKGPIEVNKSHYQVWALVPSKLGDIHKVNNYWQTSDGMKFVNSRDAAEYLINLTNKQATQTPYTRPELTIKVADALKPTEIKRPEVKPMERRTLNKPVKVEQRAAASGGEANKAVSSGMVKLQQLVDDVRKLQLELGFKKEDLL